MAMVLSMLTLTAAASETSLDTIEFDWTASADTENTQKFNIGEKLPEDAKVTAVTFSLENSSLLKSLRIPEYTPDTNQAWITLTTVINDEPASGRVCVATVTTSNYGSADVVVNLTLTGKYRVNISAIPVDKIYDGFAHTGVNSVSGTLTNGSEYSGSDYVYSYKKADGTPLSEAPKEVGEYKVTISIPEDNENYKGSVTYSFKIISEAEASYQTEENGEWKNGILTEAFSKVYKGGTVKLLKDVVLLRTETITKKLTLTNDENNTFKITTETDNHGYLLQISDDVTFENITIDGGSGNNIKAQRALIAVNGDNAKLTLKNGAVVQNNNNEVENGAGGGVCVITGELVIDGGVIANNSAYLGGGVAVYGKNSKAVLTKGSISENTGTVQATTKIASGGGAYIYLGEFTQNGGKIENNKTTKNNGGGIYLLGGTYTLNNGTIENNTSAKAGGGAYVSKDNDNNAVFNMTGGKIIDNKAPNSAGGAVMLNYSTFNISGGEISKNTANKYAGGIECSPGSYINISGAPVIKDNISKEEEKNGGVYIDGHPSVGWANVNISELSENADIKFCTWGQEVGFKIASPAENYTITTDDLSKMEYVGAEYDLTLADNGTVVLTDYTWEYDTDAGYYLNAENEKVGLMRFLFSLDLEKEIEKAGIFYYSASEGVSTSSVKSEKAITSTSFYGDITDIPENSASPVYAMGYVVTKSGKTIYSEIKSCAPNWETHFTGLDVK